MAESVALSLVAVVGFAVTVVAGTAYGHRLVPLAYPRERTRLDERTYAVVRSGLAAGTVLGSLGAVASLVDTVGTVRAIESGRGGLLAGVAILLPDRLGGTLVLAGVALLIGAGLLAGVVEIRNARAEP